VGCFSCQATIEIPSGGRVGFRDDCSSCHSDLHVCRNCAHHDPGAHNECRESNAEWVSDRERANRCDYFVWNDRPGERTDDRGQTLADLDALFKRD